jgi:shikimate dehydrogenase
VTVPVAGARPTRLVLLGHPVAHSSSPRFHNAALRAAGLPVRYEALDTPPERLAATLETLRREGAGGNVTIPHKEAVRVACSRVTALAARVGAVNTFWTEGGVLHGDNTDVAGFERAAAALLGGAPPGLTVALLGAGGAARAVLAAVERWADARVVLHNRGRARAERLAAEFPVVARIASRAEDAVAGADLVVNASPVGLHADEMPVRLDALSPDAAVLDLVYRPDSTPWVRAAIERGHAAEDGTTMLLEQGAEAFRRWFGVDPDRAVMRAALGRTP